MMMNPMTYTFSRLARAFGAAKRNDFLKIVPTANANPARKNRPAIEQAKLKRNARQHKLKGNKSHCQAGDWQMVKAQSDTNVGLVGWRVKVKLLKRVNAFVGRVGGGVIVARKIHLFCQIELINDADRESRVSVRSNNDSRVRRRWTWWKSFI